MVEGTCHKLILIIIQQKNLMESLNLNEMIVDKFTQVLITYENIFHIYHPK